MAYCTAVCTAEVRKLLSDDQTRRVCGKTCIYLREHPPGHACDDNHGWG